MCRGVVCGTIMAWAIIFGACVARADAPVAALADAATQPSNPSTAPAADSTVATSTQPATAPADPFAADVSACVAQLSADDWSQRQKAEARLIAIGPPAKPALVRARATATDEEVRTRLDSILLKIDQRIAAEAHRITLHLHDVEAPAALAELCRQGHVAIKLWPPNMWGQPGMAPAPRVTIDADRQPFWPVMFDFCTKAGLQVQQMGRNNISLMQGQGGRGPRAVSGDFMIVPTFAFRNRQVTYGGGAGMSSNDSIQFEVFVDPSLAIAEYDGMIHIDEAIDDKGNSVAAPRSINSFYQSTHGMYMWNCGVPLSLPTDGYTKLASMKAHLNVRVATKTERLKIDDVEKSVGVNHNLAGITLNLKQFTRNGDTGFSCQVMITRSGMAPDRFNNLYQDFQGCQILDADGQALSTGWGGGGGGEQFNYSTSSGGADPLKYPLKLSWDLVTESRPQRVKFEFKDLPLPTP